MTIPRTLLESVLTRAPAIAMYGGIAIDARDLTVAADVAKRKLKAAIRAQALDDDDLWRDLAAQFPTDRRLAELVRTAEGVVDDKVQAGLDDVDAALDAAQAALADAQAITRQTPADESAAQLAAALDKIARRIVDVSRSSRELFTRAVDELQVSVRTVSLPVESELPVNNSAENSYRGAGDATRGAAGRGEADHNQSAVSPIAEARPAEWLPTGWPNDRR